jgi:hypothetical protein
MECFRALATQPNQPSQKRHAGIAVAIADGMVFFTLSRARWLAVGACLIGWSGCGASGSSSEPTFDQASAELQGAAVDDQDIGVVRIWRPPGNACTATFIAPNVLITAQHCVAAESKACEAGMLYGAPSPPSDYVVRPGTYYLQSDALSDVREVRFPSPTGSCSPDIALLILSDNLGNQKRIHEPRLDSAPRVGEPITEVGYGGTDSAGNGQGTRRRLDGQVRCSDQTVCAVIGGNLPLRAGDQFAAGIGQCHGDSGGPSFDAQMRVMGVVSTGVTSSGADCPGPGVYIRVDAYKTWIINTVRYAAGLGGYAAPAWAGGAGVDTTHQGSGDGTGPGVGQGSGSVDGGSLGYGSSPSGGGAGTASPSSGDTTGPGGSAATNTRSDGTQVDHDESASAKEANVSPDTNAGSGGCALAPGVSAHAGASMWALFLCLSMLRFARGLRTER